MTVRSPSRRRRRLASLGGLLLVAGCGIAALRSPWVMRWAARGAERLASQALGEEVVLGELSVAPTAGRLVVRGLVITHRSDDPGTDGRAVVAAESVEVELGLRGWQPVARRIRVVRPVVTLHIDEDGLREFREAAPQQQRDAFPWQELWIDNARFRLETPGGSVLATGVDVRPAGGEDAHRLQVGSLHLDTDRWHQEAEDLEIAPIVFTPHGLDLPDLALSLPVADLRGAVTLPFQGTLEGDLAAELRLDELNGLIPAHLLLAGEASAEVDLGGTLASPHLEGAVLISVGELRRIREGEEALMVEAEGLSTGFVLEDQLLEIAPLTAAWSGGRVHGQAVMDLSVKTLSASLTGESLSASEVFVHTGVSPAPWVDFDGDLELQLAGTLRPLHVAGTLEVAGQDVRIASGPLQHTETLLRFSRLTTRSALQVLEDRVLLKTDWLRTARSRGQVDVDLSTVGDRQLDLGFDLSSLALEELRPLADLEPTGTAAFSGRLFGPMESLSLQGQVKSAPFGLLGFTVASSLESPVDAPTLQTVRLPALDARLGGSEFEGQTVIELGKEETWVDLDLLLTSGRLRDLARIFVETEQLDGAVTGGLSVRGPGTALDGELDLDLEALDLFGERFDDGRAALRVVKGGLVFDRVVVERGSEGAYLRGTLDPEGALNLDVATTALQLETLDSLAELNADLRGLVSLKGHVGGTVQQPAPAGRVDAWDLRLGRNQLGDSRLDFDSKAGVLGFYGTLAGTGVDVAGTLDLEGDNEWTAQADLHDFPAHVFYPTTPDGTPLEARVSGTVVAAGELAVEGRPFSVTGETEAVEIDWDIHRLRAPERWRVRWTESLLDVEGVSLTGGKTSLSLAGEGDRARLDLTGGGVFDLDLVRAFVPGLERSDGLATVTVTMQGLRGSVAPEATLAVDGANFDASFLPEAMEETHLRLRATPSRFSLDALDARMGGGVFEGGGFVDAEAWRPLRYDLWSRLDEARVQWFDWLPPVSGSAAVSFVGPASDPLMKGRVDVSQMVFADRIDWEDAVVSLSDGRLEGAASEASPDLFSMDITLVSEDTIRVRNNLGDLTASGELRVVGDTARPGLVGDLRATPGGRVYLKEREFELQRGEIHFVEPTAFDPELDIALATEVRTLEDEYAIDYRISGPWSDWRAESSSAPALPEADINALLLFGMTRDEIERYGGALSALALEGGDLLASKFGLVETLGGGIYGLEILRPERIDIVSGVTERGSASISSELRILAEKDLDWATLILEQNLSRLSDTYIGLERRLANRLYLRSYWARQQVGRQLNTGGAWGLDFRMRWEVD